MTPDFHTRFRQELLAAASRSQRRRRRRRRGLAAGAVTMAGVMTAIVITLHSPGPVDAAVLVTPKDGRVEVLLTDLERSADDVRQAVAEAGLNVHVEPVPVGPSNAGRFVGNTATGSGLEDIEHVDEAGDTFMGFSIPDQWAGALTILIGRPARGDESYAVLSDAYAPGEPLACSGTLGQPLEAAADSLAALTVSVRGPAGTGGAATPLADALRSAQAGWDISSAYAISADELLVTVSPTPVDLEEASC